MKKITRDAITAFDNNYTYSNGNTKVRIVDNQTRLYLHDNMIACKKNGRLFITTCGWDTLTTKERLNGLSGVSVYTKKHQLYLNNKIWDGELVNVGEWGEV